MQYINEIWINIEYSKQLEEDTSNQIKSRCNKVENNSW